MVTGLETVLTATASSQRSKTREKPWESVAGTVTKWYQLNMPISTEELAELITGTICSGLRI